jgi:hypothetical protein
MLSGAGCHTAGEGAGGGDAAVVLLSRCMLFCTAAVPSVKPKHLFLFISHNKVTLFTKYNCAFYLVTEHGNFLA